MGAPGPLDPHDDQASGLSGLSATQASDQPAERQELRITLPAILLGTGREVLMRVIDGDPLDLTGRVESQIQHHALLLDPARAVESSQAQVAFAAGGLSGEGFFAQGEDLSSFLAVCVDRALLEVMDEDFEEERCGMLALPPWPPVHGFLARTLGIEAPLARQATVVFNHLAWETRRAFCAVMLEGKSLHRWIAEGNGPPERAKARIEHALSMLGTLGEHTGADPDKDLPIWELDV